MSVRKPSPEEERPQFLKLVRADDHEPAKASDVEDRQPGKISENVRLPQFYFRWFRKIVIEGEGLAEGTEDGYLCLLHWWKLLTSDPPLRLIDEFLIASFAAKLRKATYRRGPFGVERTLSANRVALLLRNLRSLLNRVGPQRDPNKATAKLPLTLPAVPVETIEADPKPCFEIEQARRIVEAAYRIDRPKLEDVEPWQFWRALLAWYYVTSLRRGSLLAVEWSMLRPKGLYQCLTVPARAVGKTGKPKEIVIPPWAWEAVAAFPRRHKTIFVWPHDVDHLNDVHYELQTLAGIPAEQQLSIQGWRRTHIDTMGMCGLDFGNQIAQHAGDHADGRTTRRHYSDLENRVRLRLPPLWDPPPPDDPQLKLF